MCPGARHSSPYLFTHHTPLHEPERTNAYNVCKCRREEGSRAERRERRGAVGMEGDKERKPGRGERKKEREGRMRMEMSFLSYKVVRGTCLGFPEQLQVVIAGDVL